MESPFVKLLSAAFCAWFAVAIPCRAADMPELRGVVRSYTFAEAVQTAESNYPSIQASVAREQGAKQNVSLTRTSFLPTLDTVYQQDYGSISRMNGIYVPIVHIPLIVSPTTHSENFRDSVAATTAGAILNWELIDFGLRRAQVRAAQAQHREAEAGVVFTRFDAAVAAADAFFAVLLAEQRVRAEAANVQRFEVFTEQVSALVRTDLRAGVDLSRAEAEVARAKDRLIQTQQDRDMARARLAQRMGIAGEVIDVMLQPFAILPTTGVEASLPPFEQHPLALQNAAIINTVLAREKVLSREYAPHLTGFAAIQGRGAGINGGPSVRAGGLLPDIPNWTIGASVTWQLMEYFQIRFKKKIERSNEMAARARYAEIMQILKGNDAVARAEIDGAVRRAANAPAFVKAAQDTVTRARIRYKVGLGTVVDVAEAERLLTDAQVVSDTAAIAVWQAYLAAAVAHGDLTPFIKLVAETSPR